MAACCTYHQQIHMSKLLKKQPTNKSNTERPIFYKRMEEFSGKKSQEKGPLSEKGQNRKSNTRTRQKNKRDDRKVESNNSPEIPDRGETSDKQKWKQHKSKASNTPNEPILPVSCLSAKDCHGHKYLNWPHQPSTYPVTNCIQSSQ